jgi:hypothetical protein
VYGWLSPLAGRSATWGGAGLACEGPLSRWLCSLAAALGRWDDAELYYEDAVRRGRRLGMRPFVAMLQAEWAEALDRRERADDAARLRDEARAVAQALGMTELLARLTPAPAASGREIRLSPEGDVWLVEGEGERCRVKDSRGLQMLALLVASPGREVHCLELGAGPDATRTDFGDAGGGLDPQARGEYRSRLAELREELEEAEAWNDAGRAERAREETEFLQRELSRAVGLGGRDRKAASATERARVNVQRRLKLAIAHIEGLAPALGRRLGETIRTGTSCSYQPQAPRGPG